MFSISQDFAPPFKLIAPFFVIGSFFYLFASIYLFGIDPSSVTFDQPEVLAFVHLVLLGFVMMVIFGAMAQLVPVVLEVGHFGVELFYAIWPLLLIGSVMMVGGFVYSAALLPYGGVVVLIAMLIFVFEIFLTMFKVKSFSLEMKSLFIANIFLFLGIIFGLLMALGYAGTISVDISALLKAHIFAVIGGYISVTIMGLSVVLVPMFTLAHSFSKRPLEIGIYGMSGGVALAIIGSLLDISWLRTIAFIIALLSLGSYFRMIYVIFKTRPRKENDVYAISLMFSYGSMIVSLVFGVLYLLFDTQKLLMAGMWLLFFGFFAFLITGHLYKIIPFLVWFERFSPLVGKQKVPMLADMVPYKSSQAQFIFCAVGVVLITLAILSSSKMMMGAGASFMVMGTLAFIRSVFYMINFK